jgi:hypothetical protein
MTRFLRLGRNDLVTCARAERARPAGAKAPAPDPAAAKLLLDLCEPTTAREIARRRTRRGDTEFADLVQRLLDVAQGAVRRLLDDPVALRIAAVHRGIAYIDMRLLVLEFLDATPDTVTAADLAEFVRPRIATWDVDLETGVLRVVLKAHEPRASQRRRPSVRGGFLAY